VNPTIVKNKKCENFDEFQLKMVSPELA
jgi:hypothetical protein